MKRQRYLVLSIALILMLSTSCTQKAATSPFTGAIRANDDIATSIKILIKAESDLEQQKLLTPAEGLKIIDGLAALNAANIQFNTDLAAAKASGSKSALRPSLNALRGAVNELNANGVLGIKSEKAKQIFSVTIQAVNVSLGILEGFVPSR